jgi:ABC-type transport system involved in multi-copper enzyme maturation permease subunit
MLIVSFALGILLLSGASGPSLTASDYAQAAGGSLLACGLGAMLGVAIGVLVANQVAAVVATLVIVFVVDPLLVSAFPHVGKFAFGNALTAVAGRSAKNELAFGAAVAVIVAWTALALAIAGWVDNRRDIA